MPLHLLNLFGLDHHFHDDAHAHHDDYSFTHSTHHYDTHHSDLASDHHRHDAASFLSSSDSPTCQRHDPSAEHTDFSSPFLTYGGSSSKLSTGQAASFLESGLTGIARSEYHPSSFLSVQQRLTDVVTSTPPAALVPLHALSIVGALPGHLAFELGEGFLFGFHKGFALALAGKTLGSAAAFGIGRSAVSCGCLKERLQDLMNKWPISKKVAKGVEEGGGISVFVIRMAPVPCVVKNYSIALLTEIPFTTYLAASFAGLVPTTAAHVYAGTLAPSVAALASGAARFTPAQAASLASPVIAGVLLTVLSSYYLHQYVLKDEEGKENEEEDIDIIKLQKVKLDSLEKSKHD